METITKIKKLKILIDLDILTRAYWDKKKEALDFLIRIKIGEFELYTPYTLLDLVEKWGYVKLREKILDFYKTYSTKILTVENYLDKIEEKKIDEEKIVKELENNEIKDEDAALVVITIIFELDYLVTYNRKHLKNKKEVINKILRENGLKTIKIVLPNEI